jgi:hypothetical protein
VHGKLLKKESLPAYQSAQASLLVKKLVVAFAAGIDRIYVSSDSDWSNYFMPEWRNMGLVDRYGKPKPAYYTYKLIVSKLNAFTKAERVDDCIFKFTFNDRAPVFVAWSDDISQMADFTKFIPSATVKVTHIITNTDKKTDALVRKVSTQKIIVTNQPVIIEEL